MKDCPEPTSRSNPTKGARACKTQGKVERCQGQCIAGKDRAKEVTLMLRECPERELPEEPIPKDSKELAIKSHKRIRECGSQDKELTNDQADLRVVVSKTSSIMHY